MSQQHKIQTATMARIYTEQGHYRKAADIYRHLLKADPSRQDIADKLSQVEALQHAASQSEKRDLAPLLRQWIRLAVRYRQVQQLLKMRKSLSSVHADEKLDF